MYVCRPTGLVGRTDSDDWFTGVGNTRRVTGFHWGSSYRPWVREGPVTETTFVVPGEEREGRRVGVYSPGLPRYLG